MRIGLKLIAGFLTVAALVGGVGYLSAATNREIHHQVERLSRSAIIKVVDSTDMALATNAQHLAARQLVAETKRAAIKAGNDEEARTRIADCLDAIERHTGALRQSLDRNRLANASLIRWATHEGQDELAEQEAAETLRSLDRLDNEFLVHGELMDELLDLVQNNPEIEEAESFLENRLQEHFSHKVLPLIHAHRERAEGEFTSGIRNVERALVLANQRNNLITLAALFVAMVLGLTISRSISKPLTMVKNAASDIGEGHLDTRIRIDSNDEIGMLARTFNQMAKQLQEKTVSKAFVDNIIRSLREMLIVADAELRIRQVNPAMLRELGLAEDDLVGRPLAALFAFDDREDSGRKELPAGLFEGIESRFRSRGGAAIPVYCSASELRDERGEVQGVVCVAWNIAQRKAAEERLRASLSEKDVLLKEIHHRVKNNLQIISSLLSLQMQETDDSETVRLFRESRNRIRSMALIHEQLYESEDVSQIDFAEYVGQLAAHLRSSFDTPVGAVDIHVEVCRAPLPLETAIPCGMIVNELVSNAMQHAFPGGRGGEIRIAFHADNDRHVLTVGDNGVGISPDCADRRPKSLGLNVVDALVRQLHGRLEVQRDGGTRYSICFPETTAPADSPADR